MKSFLAKISVFTFLLFIGVIGLVLGQSFIMKKGQYYKLPAGTDGIILGHSHASCAYNDTLIEGVVNLSEPMEGYFYSFFKLKQILRHNKLEYVFVEFSNNQITKYADDRVFGAYIGNQLPKMMPFVGPKDLIKIGLRNPIGMVKALPVSLNMTFQYLTAEEGSYIEKHWSNDKISSHVLEDKKKKKKSEFNNASKTGHVSNTYSVSELNLFYLAQIAKLCRDNKIELYFLRAPVSPYYNLPMEGTIQELLVKEFPKVKFIDLKNFPLNDSDFADVQHMNIHGAKKISLFLSELINNTIRSNRMNLDEVIQQKVNNAL